LVDRIDDLNYQIDKLKDDLKYYKFRVFELKEKYEEEQSEDLITTEE